MKFFDTYKFLYKTHVVAVEFEHFSKTQTAMSGLRHFSSIFMSKISPFGRVTLAASAVLQAARSKLTTASRPAPCICGQINS
ncbi:MAG: hypothetical protein ACOZBW_08255 [Thermodesulfobacteriota bacterium]